jgi:8-oxo-dGTP diphosphatase
MDATTTRAFAGAFLRYGNEVLLMRRGMHKKIAPGMWSSVGGRVEEWEAESPLAACLREIREETGILPELVESLTLRYVTLVKDGDVLDSVYHFAGILKRKPGTLLDTPEGALHWVKLEDGLGLEMSAFMKKTYAHYAHHPEDESLHCVLDGEIDFIS